MGGRERNGTPLAFGFYAVVQGDGSTIVNAYYKRNTYKLDFINYNTTLVQKSVPVLYEAPIKNEFFEPEYPTGNQ